MYYIGIIYNWKGLKEENYLYTLDELRKVDPQLCIDCLLRPHEWNPSTLSKAANKTWEGKLITTDEVLYNFLKGGYNDDNLDENGNSRDDDWYWANILENDLYPEFSKNFSRTLYEQLKRLNISSDTIGTNYISFSVCNNFTNLSEEELRSLLIRIYLKKN